uniref:Uncharacterized protein n=1 Tax=Populus trichocarpa TaxID=3694 RepID=A0A2K1X872_POPTR
MVKSKKTEASNSNRENPDVLERKRLKKLAITNNIVSDTQVRYIRKSQRKNRYLPSFPGLLAPVNGGGKIGELKDLSSKSPVLYLDFRQLTLQFSRSGKNVMCEDYFDHMIVFSEAWWIGTKEENPEELKLDFLKELFEEGQEHVVDKSGGTKYVKEESPETELDDDDNKYLKGLKEVMPIQNSVKICFKNIFERN